MCISALQMSRTGRAPLYSMYPVSERLLATGDEEGELKVGGQSIVLSNSLSLSLSAVGRTELETSLQAERECRLHLRHSCE